MDSQGSENRIISLPTFFDVRGNLSIMEQFKQVPFEIRRVYWIIRQDPLPDPDRSQRGSKTIIKEGNKNICSFY